MCTGVRQVILLKDLKQLEQSGHAEVELKLASVQVHTARPVPGIITCTDPHIILISLQPRILLIDNFLPAADCQVGPIAVASTSCFCSSFRAMHHPRQLVCHVHVPCP